MLKNLKHTFKHTAVYSIGNISTKLIGVILLPLYLKYVTPGEYGILGILETTILLTTQLISFGLPNAILRFFNLDKYKDKQKESFFTLLLFTVTICGMLLAGGLFSSKSISNLFSDSTLFQLYLTPMFVVIALRTINNVLLSQLRARDQSIQFAIFNILKLIFILSANIFFVVHERLDILGILYAYVAGEILMLLLFIPIICKYTSWSWDKRLLNEAIVFGFPLIIGGLAHMFLNIGNRYILKFLTSYEVVGIYSLGYKIAGIVNMLLIQSFQMALLPIAYRMFGQDGDRRFYSKMLTYFVFILCLTSLAITFYFENILGLMGKINPDWLKSLSILPILLLGFIFSGAKMVANIGLTIKGKTKIIAMNTFGIAILNIILNFILIPHFKMAGAALANTISFLILYISSHYFAQKHLPVPYENNKLATMILTSTGLFFLYKWITIENIWGSLLFKLLLLILFPILLGLFHFYEPIEIQRIKEFIKGRLLWRNAAEKNQL